MHLLTTVLEGCFLGLMNCVYLFLMFLSKMSIVNADQREVLKRRSELSLFCMAFIEIKSLTVSCGVVENKFASLKYCLVSDSGQHYESVFLCLLPVMFLLLFPFYEITLNHDRFLKLYFQCRFFDIDI